MFDIKGLSFFLLGQNYHLIHHLYPRIPFYDYPKVYVELEEEILGEGAKVVKLGDGI
jgi:fatty acid desaturase